MRSPILLRHRATVAVFALLLSACGGDAATSPDGSFPPEQQPPGQQPPGQQPPGQPGTGRFENPAGPRFTLPDGVKLAGPIGALVPEDGQPIPGCVEFALDTTKVKRVGKGIRAVALCMPLRNDTDRAIEVRFPPRMIVLSKRTQDQHGVLIELEERIVVPARRTVWVELALFCINESRSIPSAASEYELGPATDDAGLKEISELVHGKNLADFQSSLAVQWAVWDVTDGDGLNEESRRMLRALPVTR